MSNLLTLKAGTIIHWNGFPFRLRLDTEVDGLHENMELASKADAAKKIPIQESSE